MGFGHFVIFFGPCTSSGSRDTNVPSQDDHAITINLQKKREEIFQSSNQHQPTRLAVVLFMIPPRFHHVSMKSRSYSSTSKARPWLGTVLPAACGFRQTPGMGRFGRKNWGMMVLDGLGGLEAWRLLAVFDVPGCNQYFRVYMRKPFA